MYLFIFPVYEGSGIRSSEEGLGKVGRVGVEIIRVAADSPPPHGQRKEDGGLCE